jgi:hypothetical protein
MTETPPAVIVATAWIRAAPTRTGRDLRHSSHPDEVRRGYEPAERASRPATSVRWKFWNDRDAVGPR